ncbi:MAG: DUF72 domain-containing protein [Deltaproteobacteria bacterium]|nr:DUF72 domain-containing protein [Candidatus Zymogenaceae bacterium]
MAILMGTSGFSFPDWVGTVYPAGLNKAEWLAYYERELGFSALEVNYSYYTMPSIRTLAAMSAKTSPDFTFVVKAHGSMTHDLWTDKKRHDMVDNRQSFSSFTAGVSGLAADGRLSAVLAQFPYFFYRNASNEDYLVRFRELMGDIPTVVEFRNRDWHDESARDILRDNGLGYCVVDEPKLSGLMPFYPTATTDIGYFRFHGRNPRWFNVPMEVRYDYRYSKGELAELIPPIVDLSKKTRKTLVFFNNCHLGSAAKNAAELARMVFEQATG